MNFLPGLRTAGGHNFSDTHNQNIHFFQFPVSPGGSYSGEKSFMWHDAPLPVFYFVINTIILRSIISIYSRKQLQ